MQKITLNTLHGLLTLGATTFSYTKMDGKVKKTRGTNNPFEIPTYSRPTKTAAGGFTTGGNLSYYDLEADQWKSVWAGATVMAQLTKSQTPTPAPAATTTVATKTVPVLFEAFPLQLVELLSKKIVRFEYETVKSGTRQAYGTNDATRVSKIGALTGQTLSYYDIEKEDIRSVSLKINHGIKILDIIDLPLKK